MPKHVCNSGTQLAVETQLESTVADLVAQITQAVTDGKIKLVDDGKCEKVCHKDKCAGTGTNPVPVGTTWMMKEESMTGKGCCALYTGACDNCCPWLAKDAMIDACKLISASLSTVLTAGLDAFKKELQTKADALATTATDNLAKLTTALATIPTKVKEFLTKMCDLLPNDDLKSLCKSKVAYTLYRQQWVVHMCIWATTSASTTRPPPYTALCTCSHVQTIRSARLLDGAVSSQPPPFPSSR